jgi:hypothetical protein
MLEGDMRRRMVVGVLAGAVALAGSGCGSDESTTPRAEFVQQANAVCVRLSREFNKEITTAFRPREGRPVSQETTAARVLPVLIAMQRRAISQLEDLDPPSAVQDDFERMTTAMRERIELFPTVADAAAGRDPRAKAREAQEARVASFARSAGLRRCG